MLMIGLTGGIGSGKTVVAKLFAERGITIIDADQIARDLTRVNQPAFEQIITRFGPEILLKDGTLNRGALRKLIFANENDRLWLEQLLHPLIRAEIQRKAEKAQSAYCIVAIPLLLETTPNPLIQRILIVDTPPEEQIKRTQARDNISADEVIAIINTQISRKKRLAAAHDVIDNSGKISDLIPQIDRLNDLYAGLANNTNLKS